VRFDHVLTETPPAAWGPGISLEIVPGGFGFHEIALFHQRTRTAVLTDLVLNLEPGKLPALLRWVAHGFGITAPNGMAPPYLRFVVRLRRQSAVDAATRVLDWHPERVIFAHGDWFREDGTNRLRTSLRWLVGGQ
jgi:hypothetical protein